MDYFDELATYLNTIYCLVHIDFYFTGDVASCDKHNCYRIIGREGGIISRQGFKLGRAEIENVLVSHYIVSTCTVMKASYMVLLSPFL